MLKIALYTHALRMGGAERWIVDLAATLDRRRLDVVGLVISSSDVDAHLFRKAEAACPVYFERDSPRVFAAADVLVYWGSAPTAPAPPRVVYASHGSGVWAARQAAAVLERGHRLVAVSREAAAVFPAAAPYDVLYNGVDAGRLTPALGRAAFRGSLAIAADEIVIGYLGRFDWAKNPQAAAVAAAALGPPYRSLYVGPADANEALVEAIRGADPHARIAGRIEAVGDAYAAMDVFMLASESEGFSLAMIEAWLAGVPVVATPVGAIPELEARFGGRLAVHVPVEPSADDLAEAVRSALSQENLQTVARARSIAAAHFTREAMGRRWTDYLCSLPYS